MNALAEYEKCRDTASRELAALRASGARIGLSKSTSNLFRTRQEHRKRKIDLRAFSRVLNVDGDRMTADVEGMTTYETLVSETLRHGLLPAVSPQLKTITVGGAVSGLGIESSSFRCGLVHETVDEMEVLVADGRTVCCSRNRNSDLFYALPNSYGTLGYILRLTVRLIPAKQYVRVTHSRYSDPAAFFRAADEGSAEPGLDFLDGVVFGRGEMYLSRGHFVSEAPSLSDYTYLRIYYQSIRRKPQDYLSARDYIWRWDTDWFWCSRQFYLQHPAVRLLATKWLLNSKTYQRIMRASNRLWPRTAGAESVIQDVDIPVENAAAFLEFLLSEIPIAPIWICPFRCLDPTVTYPLYSLDPRKLYINFGFWDVIPSAREPGYYNRLIEQVTLRLQGRKALYSSAYYDVETFWALHNRRVYDEVKSKYDPTGVLGDLYGKCVERQ